VWCLCVAACGCDEVGREVDDCDNSVQCICKQSVCGVCVVACGCDEVGREVDDCDNSGQCICKQSFTGRTCDRCAAGFYRYPECICAFVELIILLTLCGNRLTSVPVEQEEEEQQECLGFTKPFLLYPAGAGFLGVFNTNVYYKTQ